MVCSSSASRVKSNTSKFARRWASLGGLRDRRGALLQDPAQRDLAGRLAVALADGLQDRVVADPPASQWAVGGELLTPRWRMLPSRSSSTIAPVV